MKQKILIDATHAEETRVVVLDQNRNIENYEFEIASKKEIKGNIYLAKVTKVEASLQAAFVDYGDKKQGFLPFNEINFTFFNLSQSQLDELANKQKQYKESVKAKYLENLQQKKAINSGTEESANNEKTIDTVEIIKDEDNTHLGTEAVLHDDTSLPTEVPQEETVTPNVTEIKDYETEDFDFSDKDFMQQLETENLEYGSRFGYKIQDVIKPDQYILVQVVKDERGNKGASLTTYLSIPGRFCVLMPNTPFEGGVSKKISNVNDRQRLKTIISNLSIDDNTNIIIRTASIERTDTEIIDDYNYITTVWQNIQKQVSTQKRPGILFEEGALVKRIIRDIYSGEVEDVVIEGKKVFEEAKNFAKLIAPDLMDKIVRFHHPKFSLFKHYKLEDQIKNIYSPVVFLKSGGYIVINVTEALTAIDINSGKSKGRRNIEETALKTNLDAAVEIARQVKLRDLGGLIVIDFIDMENPKNKSMVEKTMRDLMKEDKAKVQVSPISAFGLLEISRQRIKASIIERSYGICSKCQGLGHTKPLELTALDILRSLQHDVESNKIKVGESDKLVITMPTSEAFYLLNNKRSDFNQLEVILKTSIRIACNDNIAYPFYRVEEEKIVTDKTEDVTSFLERELDNHNKQKIEERKKMNVSTSNPNERRHNNKNKRYNSFNKNKKPHQNKPVAKKGFLSKLFGL